MPIPASPTPLPVSPGRLSSSPQPELLKTDLDLSFFPPLCISSASKRTFPNCAGGLLILDQHPPRCEASGVWKKVTECKEKQMNPFVLLGRIGSAGYGKDVVRGVLESLQRTLLKIERDALRSRLQRILGNWNINPNIWEWLFLRGVHESRIRGNDFLSDVMERIVGKRARRSGSRPRLSPSRTPGFSEIRICLSGTIGSPSEFPMSAGTRGRQARSSSSERGK